MFIHTKFNMTENSRKLVENDRIIAGGAPEPFQERIVDVLQALLRKQAVPTGK